MKAEATAGTAKEGLVKITAVRRPLTGDARRGKQKVTPAEKRVSIFPLPATNLMHAQPFFFS